MDLHFLIIIEKGRVRQSKRKVVGNNEIKRHRPGVGNSEIKRHSNSKGP